MNFKRLKLKYSLNSLGFSITEILVAVALLSIVIAAISYFVTTQNKIAKVISGSEQCMNAAQSVVDKIASLGVRDRVAEVYMSTSGQTKPPGSVISWTPDWYALDLVQDGTPIVLNNAQHIIGAVGAAQAILNSNPGLFCNNGIGSGNAYEDVALRGGEYPQILHSNIGVLNPRVWLNIQLEDLNTGLARPCPTSPIQVAPKTLSAPSPLYKMGGDVDIALVVTVSIEYLKPDGTAGFCQAQSKFQQSSDSVNGSAKPSALPPRAGPTGNLSLTSGPGGSLTSCDGSAGYDTITATIDFSGAEPGSVLLCQGSLLQPAPQAGKWTSCDLMRFPGQGSATEATWDPTTKRVVLKFPNLPSNVEYSLSFFSVDTAGNASPAGDPLRWIIDSQRPTLSEISETPNSAGLFMIGPAGDNKAGRAEPAVAPWLSDVNWGITDSKGQSVVQCNASRVQFGAGCDDVITSNMANCMCSGMNCFGCCGGTTTLDLSTTGTKTVQMTSRDVCGAGGTQSYSWTVVKPGELTTTNDNTTHSFDRDKTPAGTSFYRINVPAPSGHGYWATQCDCSAPNGTAPARASVACASNVDVVGAACKAPVGAVTNFSYKFFDVCGFEYATSTTNGQPLGSKYEVHGDVGDVCGDLSCGSNDAQSIGTPNLVCCDPVFGRNCTVPGYCVDTTGLPDVCSGVTWGAPPSDCEADPGLFNCDYHLYCTGSEQYGVSIERSTNIVTEAPGGACTYTIAGQCADVAGVKACYNNFVPAPNNTGVQTLGPICTDAANNTRNCRYTANGVWSSPIPTNTNGCERKTLPLSSMVTTTNVCMTRGPLCNAAGTPVVPSPDPCPGSDTYAECEPKIVSPSDVCAPLGSGCFALRSCAPAFASSDICNNEVQLLASPAKEQSYCAPKSVGSGPALACHEVKTCGLNQWSSLAACQLPGPGGCGIPCEAVTGNPSCFRCNSVCDKTAAIPEYDTPELCAGSVSNGNRQYCETLLKGSQTCYVRKQCPDGPPWSWTSKAICEGFIGNPSQVQCRPYTAEPKCWVQESCGGDWSSVLFCQDPAFGDCKEPDNICNEVNSCFRCECSTGGCVDMPPGSSCPSGKSACTGSLDEGYTCCERCCTEGCDGYSTPETCEAARPAPSTQYCKQDSPNCYKTQSCDAGAFSTLALCEGSPKTRSCDLDSTGVCYKPVLCDGSQGETSDPNCNGDCTQCQPVSGKLGCFKCYCQSEPTQYTSSNCSGQCDAVPNKTCRSVLNNPACFTCENITGCVLPEVSSQAACDATKLPHQGCTPPIVTGTAPNTLTCYLATDKCQAGSEFYADTNCGSGCNTPSQTCEERGTSSCFSCKVVGCTNPPADHFCSCSLANCPASKECVSGTSPNQNYYKCENRCASGQYFVGPHANCDGQYNSTTHECVVVSGTSGLCYEVKAKCSAAGEYLTRDLCNNSMPATQECYRADNQCFMRRNIACVDPQKTASNCGGCANYQKCQAATNPANGCYECVNKCNTDEYYSESGASCGTCNGPSYACQERASTKCYKCQAVTCANPPTNYFCSTNCDNTCGTHQSCIQGSGSNSSYYTCDNKCSSGEYFTGRFTDCGGNYNASTHECVDVAGTSGRCQKIQARLCVGSGEYISNATCIAGLPTNEECYLDSSVNCYKRRAKPAVACSEVISQGSKTYMCRPIAGNCSVPALPIEVGNACSQPSGGRTCVGIIEQGATGAGCRGDRPLCDPDTETSDCCMDAWGTVCRGTLQ